MMLTTIAAAAASCILTAPTAFAQFHQTHGAFNMRDAFLAEARETRLQNRDNRLTLYPALLLAISTFDASEDQSYAERGSLYYEDGVTLIPGNDDPGKQSVDPRVPEGFADPRWHRIYSELDSQISTSVFEDEALEDVTAETVDSGWANVIGWGELYVPDNGGNLNQMLNANPSNKRIIRRTCLGCATSHYETYYRRFTTAPSNLIDILKSDWVSTSNVLGTDFNLYSSYEEAVNNANPWTNCTYDEPDIAFPGKCGPLDSIDGQWATYQPRQGQPDVVFHVRSATAPSDSDVLSEIEIKYDAIFKADRVGSRAIGPCWNLNMIDDRRGCWRACEFANVMADMATIKLCRNYQKLGQVVFNEYSATVNEFEGFGTEIGSLIKPTHPLGFDDGIPNDGTW